MTFADFLHSHWPSIFWLLVGAGYLIYLGIAAWASKGKE